MRWNRATFPETHTRPKGSSVPVPGTTGQPQISPVHFLTAALAGGFNIADDRVL